MASSLGEAVLDLTADQSKLDQQLDKTKKGVDTTAGKIEKAFTAIATSAILKAVVDTYKALIRAGEEAAVTEAKVAGVIRATGNAAGYTVGELSDMADEFSKMTGFDDEMILNAEAVLLTFREIGRDVFPDAMKAAIDMSAVLGQDLQSSVIQLGKALNDPIQGVTALRRVGVSFTEDQMDMIKSLVETNDLVGAQQVILDELNAEFGGTAEEMEKATAGGKRLEVSVGNLKETMGKSMIPAQREWNYWLAETIDNISENVDSAATYRDALSQVADQHGLTHDELKHARASSKEFNEEVLRSVNEIIRWTQYGAAWETALAGEAQAIAGVAQEVREVDYKSLLDLTSSLAKENENFANSQEAVRAKQAAIKTEIDMLIAQGWSPLSQKVQDLQTDYSELGLRYDENAQKHREKTNQILYDLLLQKLSVDGLTQDEYELALQAGQSFGVLDQEAIDTARNFDLVAQAVADGKIKVEDMQKALDLLPSMKSIDVVINAIANMSSLGLINQGVPPSVAAQYGYAEGTDGWMQVPAGYPGDTYPVMLSSGEMFSVIPSGGSQGAGMSNSLFDVGNMDLGGGGGMQFVYSPMISTADEYEARRVLGPFIEGKVRELSKR